MSDDRTTTSGSAVLIEARNPREWVRPHMGAFDFLYDDDSGYREGDSDV